MPDRVKTKFPGGESGQKQPEPELLFPVPQINFRGSGPPPLPQHLSAADPAAGAASGSGALPEVLL